MKTQARGEARQADFGEKSFVDEEDGDFVAVAPGELCVTVHIDDLPHSWRFAEMGFHFGAHRLAEVTVRPREQPQADHGASLLV